MPGTSSISSTASQLRQALRGVASSVTLVATSAPSGSRHTMLASSFTPVSIEPPTVLVCINRRTSIHAPLLAAGRFCINVLRPEHAPLAAACAAAQGEERFAHPHWRFDATDGLPYIAGAQAALFCTLLGQRAVGTHSVLIGHVEEVRSAPDAQPLIYLNGVYGAVRALDSG